MREAGDTDPSSILTYDVATSTRMSVGEIGFVGLGRMGTAMASNLVAAGFRVRAYVRRQEVIEQLGALGIRASTNFSDVFDCGIVITMLPDDTVVRDVVFGSDSDACGLARGMAPGSIHLSMSTISTAAASLLAAEHGRRGQGYVAAPVFGNPDAARARELVVVAAGQSSDVASCRPVLSAVGQQTFVVGSDPAVANLIKLVGNMLTATSLEVLGEIMTLLRKRGVDPASFLNIVTQTLFSGRVHKLYGAKIAAERYEAGGFTLPLALKDVRLALAEAETATVPMPSVGVVRDRLVAGIARGHAALDWTALGIVAAEAADLGNGPPTAGGKSDLGGASQ